MLADAVGEGHAHDDCVGDAVTSLTPIARAQQPEARNDDLVREDGLGGAPRWSRLIRRPYSERWTWRWRARSTGGRSRYGGCCTNMGGCLPPGLAASISR